MRRTFWLTVGAAGTVVAYQQGRKLVEKFLPEKVAERAQESAISFGDRLKAAADEFTSTFTEARKSREAELTGALLAGGQSLEAIEALRNRDRSEPELARGHRVVEVIRASEFETATPREITSGSGIIGGGIVVTAEPHATEVKAETPAVEPRSAGRWVVYGKDN